MRLGLIGVPTNSSGRDDGVARAPSVLRGAGLVDALTLHGLQRRPRAACAARPRRGDGHHRSGRGSSQKTKDDAAWPPDPQESAPGAASCRAARDERGTSLPRGRHPCSMTTRECAPRQLRVEALTLHPSASHRRQPAQPRALIRSGEVATSQNGRVRPSGSTAESRDALNAMTTNNAQADVRLQRIAGAQWKRRRPRCQTSSRDFGSTSHCGPPSYILQIVPSAAIDEVLRRGRS